MATGRAEACFSLKTCVSLAGPEETWVRPDKTARSGSAPATPLRCGVTGPLRHARAGFLDARTKPSAPAWARCGTRPAVVMPGWPIQGSPPGLTHSQGPERRGRQALLGDKTDRMQ
ncbi:MAG TPA: hypothetical protein VFV57_00080, partial [Limnobacter sp.]|nr:hypothetical protein [Limnobacter sp.]